MNHVGWEVDRRDPCYSPSRRVEWVVYKDGEWMEALLTLREAKAYMAARGAKYAKFRQGGKQIVLEEDV